MLELLVVVFIIGILATMFTLSMGVAGGDRELDQETRRLQALVNIAQEEAVFNGREIGLRFLPAGYEFSAYNLEESVWEVLSADALLKPRELPVDLAIQLEIDGRLIVLEEPRERGDADEKEEDYQPQIFIFSSGDLTPFELLLRRPFESEGVSIRAQADGTIEVERDEV